MKLIVHLSNSSLGDVILDESEPAGLESFSVMKKRDNDTHGFIYEFSVNLDFIKEGRDFVQSVFEAEGADGIININIYRYDTNLYKPEIEYQGRLQLDNYTLDEVKITTNVEPIGFQRRFLNYMKRSVNMNNPFSQDGQPIGTANVEKVMLPSKAILKQYEARPSTGDVFTQSGLANHDIPSCGIGPCDFTRIKTVYGFIDNSNRTFDEFNSTVSQTYGFSELNPLPFHIVTPDEVGVSDLNINLSFKHIIKANKGSNSFHTCSLLTRLAIGSIKAIFRHSDNQGNIISQSDIGSNWTIPLCFDFDEWESDLELKERTVTSLSLSEGDQLFVFFEYVIGGVYTQVGVSLGTFVNHDISLECDVENTSIELVTKTQFKETEVGLIMVYEFFEQICRSYTGQLDCFRSEYFGRTDTSTQYDTDGGGSMLSITNGRSIRILGERDVFGSWEDAFQSCSALFGLGWGFEYLDDGTQVVRVEPIQYFYNKDQLAYHFNSVSDLSMNTDIKLLYSGIKAGYPKLAKLAITNGVDDFAVSREFVSTNSNVSKILDIRSKYRASPFEIESLKRLTNSTEDSQLDDENYFIVLRRDAPYRVELGSDLESVSGVFDPDSLMNIRISPTRNVTRWGNILASNFIRSPNNSGFKFNNGTYNYSMSSKIQGESEVSEKMDINNSEYEAFFYPEIFTFLAKTDANDRKAIDNNINGYISANDWANEVFEGYLIDINTVLSENKSDVKLLRLYRQ